MPAPPSSSSEFPGVTVSGTTGPANGRTADFPSAGTGAIGPVGSATGSDAIAHVAAQFAFDIMRELARAVFGEIDAVARTQPAHLALKVGAGGGEFSGLVHEAVPHVDIDGAGASRRGRDRDR